MSKETTILTIFAIVAALGLVGALAIETLMLPQQTYAAGRGFPGCANTAGFNASQGRCYHP
jgi:hypothetical protein